MKFPYQILMIDTFATGSLEKYDSSQNIADPNMSSSAVLSDDIVMISPANAYIAFLTSSEKYGIFTYQSERVEFFDSEESMQEHLNDVFPDEVALRLQPLQKCYDEIWTKIPKQSEK